MLKSAAVAAIALATGANAFSPSLTSLSGLCANKPGLSSQSSLAGRPAAISLCQHGRNCACDSCTGARRERSMTGLKMAATTNVMEGREAGRRLLASLKPDEVRELFDTVSGYPR